MVRGVVHWLVVWFGMCCLVFVVVHAGLRYVVYCCWLLGAVVVGEAW